VLQIWVATSGCWTTFGTLLPEVSQTVWLSVGLGVLITRMSTKLRNRGKEYMTSMPTLFGLLAAAGAAYHAAQLNGTFSMDRFWITSLLILAFGIEQVAPVTYRGGPQADQDGGERRVRHRRRPRRHRYLPGQRPTTRTRKAT
jgi:hypothetical protein